MNPESIGLKFTGDVNCPYCGHECVVNFSVVQCGRLIGLDCESCGEGFGVRPELTPSFTTYTLQEE